MCLHINKGNEAHIRTGRAGAWKCDRPWAAAPSHGRFRRYPLRAAIPPEDLRVPAAAPDGSGGPERPPILCPQPAPFCRAWSRAGKTPSGLVPRRAAAAHTGGARQPALGPASPETLAVTKGATRGGDAWAQTAGAAWRTVHCLGHLTPRSQPPGRSSFGRRPVVRWTPELRLITSLQYVHAALTRVLADTAGLLRTFHSPRVPHCHFHSEPQTLGS